ncbi:MAG: hypothetical protein WC584_04125 [Candidatus Pacearchaeota archaeon]
MIKPSDVKFVSERLEENFNSLDEEDPLKKSIKRAIKDLQNNAFFGIQIPKRLIPKEYIIKYDAKNLWKYDLPQGWRLIYMITVEKEVQLVSLILEWFSHPEYEKRFHY